jgi:outer membrane protein TolC
MKLVLILYLLTLPLFSLTLNEAISKLKANSHEIQLSNKNIEQATLQVKQKQHSNFGEFDFVSSYSKYNEKRTLAPITPPITGNITTSDTLTSLGVTYKINIFNGFKTINEIDISKLSRNISQEKQKLTQNEQIYFVQSLYLDILSLESILISQNKYHEALRSLKKTIEFEVEYGKKSKLDILKIDTDIQKNNESITQIQTRVGILKSTLSIMIYGDIKNIDHLEDANNIKSNNEYDLENLPTIKIAKGLQRKANKSLDNSKSSYYPSVNFQTTYSNVYGAGDEETISSASLNLNWKIFDFGVREKSIQIAKIEQLKSSIEYEKIKLSLKNKIFEANKNILQNEKLLISAESQINLSNKIEEIEKLKYEEGQNSINDYLIAVSNQMISNAKFIESKYKLLKSKFYLNFLTKE